MEKARLTVTKTSKGKYQKTGPQKKTQEAKKVSTNYSSAPYNFVPLNDRIVEAEPIPSFDRYHKDRFTGYIDLTIETLTPLYIRDTLTMEEFRQKEEYEKEKKTFINPDFFSPGGIIRIPGSSLRGMIRTLVEIVSYGRFEFFDDRRLYFRAVGDTSRLGIDYRDTMTDQSDYYFPKIKAGILKRIDRDYYIHPSKELEGTQIYKINFDKTTRIVDGTKDFKLTDFEFKEIYFKPTTPDLHIHYRIDKKTGNKVSFKLKYAKLASVSLSKDANHPYKGFIIASGHMDKKHMHWVINEPDDSQKEIKVPESVIKEYKNDNQRNAPNLLAKADNKESVPCFYVTDNSDNIISFGHTGMFRLAYRKTIGQHIPTQLQSTDKIDIATAIFGDEKNFASRVFFEDAINEKNASPFLKMDIPKILSGPKPTCFQHYLEQKSENLTNHPKNLAHYNSDNPIRGYKLYWHRDGNDWIETDKENINKHQTQYTKITPVKPGTLFHGRIRFENLSKVELGALLFVLDLPNGCAHKLGMGKPLGLGSIKITPTLYLSDRQRRYRELFTEWDGLANANDRIKALKSAFEEYILNKNKLGEKGKNSLWELERLKELKIMLDWKNKPDNSKTQYLKLEEFRKRLVLPGPSEVIKK